MLRNDDSSRWGVSSVLTYTAYVPIVNNSMIYNPVSGLVYLSIPSSAGASYGNSVVPLDPQTGALGTPIPVGSEPNKMVVTADGRYLWVVLDGASAVRKVDPDRRQGRVAVQPGCRRRTKQHGRRKRICAGSSARGYRLGGGFHWRPEFVGYCAL